MNRHLVLTTSLEFENIISGKQSFLIRFFKKRFEYLQSLKRGDLIYLRKKGGEIIAQFNAGKLVFTDPVQPQDYKLLKIFSGDFSKEFFEEKLRENTIMVIIRIEKLEQFITSPIDVPNSKKDWVIIDPV